MSLEGYHRKDSKGNQLTGTERLLTINTQVHICIFFVGEIATGTCNVKLHTKVSSSVQ